MQLEKLIKLYADNRDYYVSDKYNESQLRTDFLDPFFELLGWDIKNAQGKKTSEREVLVEESLKAGHGANTKKPDYTFRLFSERKFFLEAKKPSVDISQNPEPARQTRRYGFTAKLKISLLSNFEHLIIYDCSEAVGGDDNVNKCRVKLYHYTEYVERFDEIKQLLSKENVYSGQFDVEWADIEARLQRFSIDHLFLEQINEWRIELAKCLVKIDPMIESVALNDLTQSYINSIVFLRVCEDRNLQEYQTLLHFAEVSDQAALMTLFAQADKKYNSGLFDLTYVNELLGDPESYIWGLIKQLYFPQSAYSFSVFSSDILGNIYEIFLGEQIVLEGGLPILKKKAENIDRDIVTTPLFIIRGILEKTVSRFCHGKNAEEILNSQFADIACGSGAFLLETYQLLHDELVDYFLKHDKTQLTPIGPYSFKLNFGIKRSLLEDSIFGVDKDYSAVQACKFGLLLKLLEDETDETITVPALPDMDANICFGNSLISPDLVPADQMDTINPHDFGDLKFDIIVGNPPYLKTEDMKAITPLELPIYKKSYTSAYKQFDKYFLFIERSLSLIKNDGAMGCILPLKFMKVGAGLKLREMLLQEKSVSEIVSFGANQVFSDKTTYTCLFFADKKDNDIISYTEAADLSAWQAKTLDNKYSNSVNTGDLQSNCWVFVPSELEGAYSHINNLSLPLGEVLGAGSIINGIQTSANKTYIHEVTAEDADYYSFERNGRTWQIEKELTRPYFKTSREVNLNTYRQFEPNSIVLYPYVNTGGQLRFVEIDELQNSYPFFYQYVMAYRNELDKASRDIKPEPNTQDEWYRYGRHQSLESCDVPAKIIVGVLSQGDKYAIDTNRTLISSGGTAGYCMITIPDNVPYSIFYVQALLNSKYGEWYASLYGEVFRGGYIARGTKVLQHLPIIPLNFGDASDKKMHDNISKYQQQLISIQSAIDSAKNDKRKLVLLRRRFLACKTQLNKELKVLFQLADDDQKIPIIKESY